MRGIQGDFAAVSHGQCAIDLNLLPGRDLQRAELEAIELIAVQLQFALPITSNYRGQVKAGGDLLLDIANEHLIQGRAQTTVERTRGGVVNRRVAADQQLRPSSHCGL